LIQWYNQSEEDGVKPHLELFARYKLFGNIESMAFVKLIGSKKDSLILAFADAKVFFSLPFPFYSLRNHQTFINFFYNKIDFNCWIWPFN